MVRSYVNGLPFPAVSIAAGHMKGTYMLPRGRIAVPQELSDRIFPFARDWLKFSEKVRCKWCGRWDSKV